MKYFLVIIVCLIVASQALNYNQTEWNNFKMSFRKMYKDVAEEEHRLRIFLENKLRIDEHNRNYVQGLTSYKMGINQFTDQTIEEMTQMFTGLKGLLNTTNSVPYEAVANLTLPDSIDWREKGAVTSVKDQGQCGSCWAFSVVGSLEGHQFIKSGKLASLSVQNLVDCSSDYGNRGCIGGWANQAFEYIQANGGIDTEESYPYEAKDGSCRFKAADVGAKITSFTEIPPGDELALQQAVATKGPVAVAIDCSGTFGAYESGVYYNANCSTTALGHAVVVVGYGTENGQDYWIVKNTNGVEWGDHGYIKMSRNKNNQCGIATRAVYPNV